MAEKMTLLDVRDWHRFSQQAAEADGHNKMAEAHKELADAIDAHLAQPAQAMDVVKQWHAPGIGEVHSADHEYIIWCSRASESDEDADQVADDDLAKTVCAALNAYSTASPAPGKEPQGMGVLAIKFTSPYSLPASPTPDKEG